MKSSHHRTPGPWLALTFTALLLTACNGTARPAVIAPQVQTPVPELLRLTEDGRLVYPCPRSDPPLETVDTATGRPTTSVGELGRFGLESDGFVTICEGRVLLGAKTLAEANRARAEVEAQLTRRTLWQRLTPWRE